MDSGEALVILVNNTGESSKDELLAALEKQKIEAVAAQHFYRGGTSNNFCVRVMQKDWQRAYKVARKLGYTFVNEDAEELKLLKFIASPTDGVSFLEGYSLTTRVFVVLVTTSIILTAIFFFCFK